MRRVFRRNTHTRLAHQRSSTPEHQRSHKPIASSQVALERGIGHLDDEVNFSPSKRGPLHGHRPIVPSLHYSIAPLANSSATSRKKRWVGDAPAQRGYEIMVEISLSVAEFYAANATSHGSPTDSTSGRGPRTDDASKDVRNRRIHLVPNNSPDYKTQVL